MALPLLHTMSRNMSRDAILAGKYSNIRIHGISGNMNPDQPWSTLAAALGSDTQSDASKLMTFSSTCYYFGESLTNELTAKGCASHGHRPGAADPGVAGAHFITACLPDPAYRTLRT